LTFLAYPASFDPELIRLRAPSPRLLKMVSLIALRPVLMAHCETERKIPPLSFS